MRVTRLSLTNFRNYGRLELNLPTGATLLHGDNAQGKTNLLEALYYLATSRSPHASQDIQLINWQARERDDLIVVGRLVAHVAQKERKYEIEIRLIHERKPHARNGGSFRREVLINRRKVRLMDLLGHLQVVLFLPEDVALISGPPSKRRRFLNITLCQVDRHYCRNLSQYNKVLEQRNAILRQLAEGLGSREVLAIYSDKLVGLGSQIFNRRSAFFDQIGREAQRVHFESLTQGNESLRLSYLPRLQVQKGNNLETAVSDAEFLLTNQNNIPTIEERFEQALDMTLDADIARGATHVGPHRDDWVFWVNGRNLSHYGSRGQQRSGMLALKLAEINWMRETTQETPILLLDEVVAELDAHRRELLLNCVQQSNQAILTSTDPKMFTESFLNEATSMTVGNGRVTIDTILKEDKS